MAIVCSLHNWLGAVLMKIRNGNPGLTRPVLRTALACPLVLAGCMPRLDINQVFTERHSAVRWIYAAQPRLVVYKPPYTLLQLITDRPTSIWKPRLCVENAVVFEERVASGTVLIGPRRWTVIVNSQTGLPTRSESLVEMQPVSRVRGFSCDVSSKRMHDLEFRAEIEGTDWRNLWTNVYLKLHAPSTEPVLLFRQRGMFYANSIIYYPTAKLLLICAYAGECLICVDIGQIRAQQKHAATRGKSGTQKG